MVLLEQGLLWDYMRCVDGYFFLTPAFLMKCLTGFVSSITLNIIIHKTNNQYTASFTISFEWQRMWPSWQQKKKRKRSILPPWPLWHKLSTRAEPLWNSVLDSWVSLGLKSRYTEITNRKWCLFELALMQDCDKNYKWQAAAVFIGSRQIICSWMGIHLQC